MPTDTNTAPMHQIINRLSGGSAELYRSLCEIAFAAVTGPQVMRRLDALADKIAPAELAEIIAWNTPHAAAEKLADACEKRQPLHKDGKTRVAIVK
jgi:hypothetical protein